ncbi:MAG: L-threonylcarbamoyladenylate synthase [Sulfitobacter sp.]|nr:L-threonylcarbamoyladenylate synthase [Sulfitobacter sp.]
MRPETERLPATAEGIARAAEVLANGSLVAFPTETVYGLGADARQGDAVAAIYEAKGRPSFNPLIVHVADIKSAQTYVEWSAQADALARLFWPGPLTLVLPLREGHGLSSLVTAGLSTVGLRVPAHPAAQAMLAHFDGPVAAPSANLSGRISPTTADHVLAGLDGRIAAVLDDGACAVGVESTIIGFDNMQAVLLRAGGVAAEEIEAVLGTSLALPEAGSITAPGQMSSHYAPSGAVRLNATKARAGEHMLGFGAVDGTLNLSASGDLAEAAANLFGHLHLLDALGGPIAVAPVPMRGLGVAINDRLNRAAAPRT